jgi:UDP-3-O-[3-hydroxymyristoyl] glucosamine N-acyltransferase
LKGHGFPAELDGANLDICAVNTLECAVEGEISFLANDKYLDALKTTQASAVLVKPDMDVPESVAAVRTKDPYAAMAVAIIGIHGYRSHPRWGISDQASIHETALIGENANIAPFATVARDVRLGKNCTLYSGCYVADGARLGDDCVLFPNVVIYDGCVLGNRCTIHAGTVIGEDGLGFAPMGEKWVKIPQVGTAALGDDVEIGANCSVDRATLGQTEIGSGTKFSNNVTIGHGCKIGDDCMFVGQVGLAGSTTVGRHVTLAGQVGAAGHLKIGDNATVGAKAGISNDLEGDKVYLGAPALPINETKRIVMAMRKLPEYINRIKALEKEIKELKGSETGSA